MKLLSLRWRVFIRTECSEISNYEQAAPIFERIVTDYPSSPKVVEAAFRLDLLGQREREEKLLYLLRVTGEEYLAAKEDYEKLIKQYQSEEAVTLRKSIRELSSRVEELETQLDDEKKKNAQLSSRILDTFLMSYIFEVTISPFGVTAFSSVPWNLKSGCFSRILLRIFIFVAGSRSWISSTSV